MWMCVEAFPSKQRKISATTCFGKQREPQTFKPTFLSPQPHLSWLGRQGSPGQRLSQQTEKSRGYNSFFFFSLFFFFRSKGSKAPPSPNLPTAFDIHHENVLWYHHHHRPSVGLLNLDTSAQAVFTVNEICIGTWRSFHVWNPSADRHVTHRSQTAAFHNPSRLIFWGWWWGEGGEEGGAGVTRCLSQP